MQQGQLEIVINWKYEKTKKIGSRKPEKSDKWLPREAPNIFKFILVELSKRPSYGN